MKAARTSQEGAFGDGKMFVSPVEEVYTVSSGDPRDGRAARIGVTPLGWHAGRGTRARVAVEDMPTDAALTQPPRLERDSA